MLKNLKKLEREDINNYVLNIKYIVLSLPEVIYFSRNNSGITLGSAMGLPEFDNTIHVK